MRNKKKGNKSLNSQKNTHYRGDEFLVGGFFAFGKNSHFLLLFAKDLPTSERNNPIVSLGVIAKKRNNPLRISLYDISKYFLLYALCFVRLEMLFVKKRIPRVKSFFLHKQNSR